MARCTARNRRGGPCQRDAIHGADVCRVHGGSAPQVRWKAQIRAQALALGLGDADIDPGELALRLLSQSVQRVHILSEELEHLVAEHGLVGAFVGETLVADNAGEMHKVGEYARGLAEQEFRERKFASDVAFRCQAAGLAQRQVELAESERAIMLEVLRAVLFDQSLGLSASQRAAVPALIRGHLGLDAATGTDDARD